MAFPPVVSAAERISSEQLRADFVVENATTKPGDTVTVALRQEIAPGWHTYWKNPGDSGLAPDLTWKLPKGVNVAEPQWPAPSRKEYGPLVNYGYVNQTAILYTLSVPAGWPVGTPLPIEAEAELLVCAEICIPVYGRLSASVETGTENRSDPQTARFFKDARARLPRPAPWSAEASASGKELRISLRGPKSAFAAVARAYFFVDEWGAVTPAAPQKIAVKDDGLMITTERGDGPLGNRLSGVVTLFRTDGSAETFKLTDVTMSKHKS